MVRKERAGSALMLTARPPLISNSLPQSVGASLIGKDRTWLLDVHAASKTYLQDHPQACSTAPDLASLSQLPPPCLQPFELCPPRPWRPFSRPANPLALNNPATSSLQCENPGPTSGPPPCPNRQIAGIRPQSFPRPIPATRPGPGRLQAMIPGPRPPPGSPPGVPGHNPLPVADPQSQGPGPLLAALLQDPIWCQTPTQPILVPGSQGSAPKHPGHSLAPSPWVSSPTRQRPCIPAPS